MDIQDKIPTSEISQVCFHIGEWLQSAHLYNTLYLSCCSTLTDSSLSIHGYLPTVSQPAPYSPVFDLSFSFGFIRVSHLLRSGWLWGQNVWLIHTMWPAFNPYKVRIFLKSKVKLKFFSCTLCGDYSGKAVLIPQPWKTLPAWPVNGTMQ